MILKRRIAYGWDVLVNWKYIVDSSGSFRFMQGQSLG